MSKQTKDNERRPDVLPSLLGSSVDSPGSRPLMANTGQGESTAGGRGGGSTQQTYYCSPPYFSSSASSSSSSSPDVGSPSEGHGAAASKYPEYKGRTKSGSTSTPLTPQEFELLSDSNPFKQDIAEKYGIAYPGITTRAHSSEFIGQAERQSDYENAEFSGAGRKKRSASVNDSVDSFTLDISTWKASSDKISRMCRGLNAFLLRNQESIEQSIASLDDTDVVIPTSEGAGVFSAPKKYDIVYVGKQNSCEDINSPVHDISPERLLDADLTEIQLEGRRTSLQSSDSKESVGSKLSSEAQSSQQVSMLPRPKQALEQSKSDPYSVIKAEDVQRKKSGSKIFSGAQAGRIDSEDDQLSFERLATRSFEESLVSQTPRDVIGKTCEQSTEKNQPFQQTKSSTHTSAFTNPNLDLLSFDDEDIPKVSAPQGRDDNSSISTKRDLINSLSSQEQTQVKVKTISNVNAIPRVIDSGKSDQNQESVDKRKDSGKSGGEISPPHEILATFDPFASVERPDKKCIDAASSDAPSSATQSRGDKFSSSFYSVFSTTVSSLEDIDSHSDQRRTEKTDTSPELHSSTWEAGDTTPSADSVFSTFSTGYERSVSEGSQGYKEPLSFSPGDPTSIKKNKASEDSGESSKESVSRDSMRVNLSQDSSVADLHDDPTVLSHLQVNGLPENGEGSLNCKQPMNATHRPEVGVPQRHLDLASMLLPMAESASTDSMFVHVSTDSLHSATSGRSGEAHETDLPDQRKLSDKSNRAQLSIDLRRKNLMEQSRRRSLPSSQFKNAGQGKLKSPILYASQSLDSTDTPELPLQRRSSVPASRPRPNAARTLQRIGSTSAPKLQYRESESEIFEAVVEKPHADADKTSKVKKTPDVTLDVSKLQPISPPQAVSPGTARPRPNSKRGSVSGDKGVPVSINLGQVASILAGTTVASTQPTTTKVKTQKLQRTKIQFTIAAKAPEPSTTEKPSSVTSPQKSDTNARFRHPSLPHQPSAEQGVEGTGFLQERRDEMSSVNTVQPPDLVPYEETFTSPMRSLPEMPQPATQTTNQASESIVKLGDQISSHQNALDVSITSEQDSENSDNKLKTSETDKAEVLPKVHIPEPCTSSSLDKPVATQAEAAEGSSSRNSIVKSNSGSDSDGGDIDTIVQEFKEDISDEGDIDDLVQEFIDEHPEAAVASPKPEPEITRQHSLGFNKFGRVLNKMQSVTKYMSKKKTFDETPKSPPAKVKLGRRSRTTSQGDGEDLSSEATALPVHPQQKDDQNETKDDAEEKKDDADPFELLSKAAEVFKAQTVNKKKSPRPKAPRVWRSMTIDTDVADLKDNEDCDLVTRAAVLFKGFKGKKAFRNEQSVPTQGTSKPPPISDTEKETGSTSLIEENIAEEREDTVDTSSVDKESSDTPKEDITQASVANVNETNLPIIVSVPASPQEGRDGAKAVTGEDKPADANIDTDTNIEMEESVSKMDDSGFESCIRYAAESSVKSDDDDDDTDGPGKVNSLLDSARDHAVFSVVEVTTPEISTYENITCKLGASIHDYVEKCMLTSTEKIDVLDRSKFDVITGDGITINKVDWPKTESEICTSVARASEAGGTRVEHHQKGDYKMITSSTTDDQSVATDSGLEMELKPEQVKPQDARPVSQTCDLILSTGYDDSKPAKLNPSESSENAVGLAPQDAREKTNGKLEELSKEILAVEAASYEAASSKPEGNKLNINSPEYQRLSSDSSENPDSNSMTVNLPDSPENGMSLAGDGPFSLCCGANFKINLNCTAMMKKPERRPSKVVIENKRCAMTEEEKMFPLKVSSSFREDFDKGDPPEGQGVEKSKDEEGASGFTKSTSNRLKVNEHERNRNFAGSREELTDQRNGSKSKEKSNDTIIGDKSIKENQKEKKVQKRRSLVEELDKDKDVLQTYDTVLHELSKKQEGVVSNVHPTGKEKEAGTSDAQERRERARAKRYGRVISESEFDDGLLPGASDESKPSQGDASFNVEAVEIPLVEIKVEEDQRQGNGSEAMNAQVIVSCQPQSSVVTSEPTLQPTVAIQQSMDVYDNVNVSNRDNQCKDDPPPPVPVREPRNYKPKVPGRSPQHGYRHHTSLGSVSSVVSDEGGRQGIRADVYLKARRAYIVHPQGKTKWVSSTPHLPAVERGGDVQATPPKSTRHSSFPHLHANSDIDVSAPQCHQYNYKTHHRVHSDGSGSSFGSESVCWGNYARVADLQLQERAPSCDDSESSTSGLFIPGGGGGVPSVCGRASTLSDVSDGYIFGDYSTVKDDIQHEENRGVIRPLDNQNQQADYSFRFRHFPEDNPHVHYENIEDLVVTTQPMGGPRQWASGPDIYCDNNYAVIGNPQQFLPGYRIQGQSPAVTMSSIGVQMSGSPSLGRQGGPIRVSNCASQTSLDSLIGLVSHDASDILEGLPVYEYTLGAGMESEDEHSEGQSDRAVASTQCPDLGQPDVTRQTASLDRHQLRCNKKKSWEAEHFNKNSDSVQQGAGRSKNGLRSERVENTQDKRKATRVTFSRDAVLTEVIDELRKSEAADQDLRQLQLQDQLDNAGVVPSGRGLRGIAASTLTSIGGGVKEFARIINSPFHCCRSGRAEPKERPKVGGPVVL